MDRWSHLTQVTVGGSGSSVLVQEGLLMDPEVGAPRAGAGADLGPGPLPWAQASGPLSIMGAGVRPARPGGDRRTRPRQLVLRQHEPRPRPAAAPVPGQRPGRLPCPAQREQPWGLFALRYRTAARASAPTLTSGSVLPRLCRPHVRPGHLAAFPCQSAHRQAHAQAPSPFPPLPIPRRGSLLTHPPSHVLTPGLIHALSVPECPPCTPLTAPQLAAAHTPHFPVRRRGLT